MRRSLLLAAIASFLCLACGQADALTIRLHANRVEFFYDRFVVEAHGNVDVRTSDGMEIRGDVFSMDLKLNRFLVAGDVQVKTRSATLSGAAISDFLNFDRIYFIPVTTEPDRWTFLHDDFAHPVPGRVMPGDTFFFANNGGHRPDVVSSNAVIGTNSYVRFLGVSAHIVGVISDPLPSFYVSFAPTPALARNSLSGADADLTYEFAGNSNSISALHFRYDAVNHAYASFEQHIASTSGNAYAVFSLNPGTTASKFWNLVTGDTMGSRFQVNTFTQLYTYQYGFGHPDASAQYTVAQATEALPRWSLQANGMFTNYNLLGPGATGVLPDGQTVGELDHPSQLELNANSVAVRIFGTPLYEQVNLGMGFNHDSLVVAPVFGGGGGLQTYGGYTYTTIWNQLAAVTISLPQVIFGNRNSAYDRYILSGNFTKQRQWYSVPHHVDTNTFNATVSRQLNHTLLAYTGYSIDNTGDYYLNGAYAVSSPFINGVYDPGFEAFKGVSTQRTFSFAVDYVPSPEFTLTFLYRHHDDFPAPVPGVFPFPPLNPIGQFQYSSNYLGQPPNDLTGDLHIKVAPHIAFDLIRTYYFGFASLKWSPSFVIQLEQPQ